MSSYKVQKNINKTCGHCGLKYPTNNLKCTHCKLWDFGTILPNVPKKDYLYNIKNVYIINLKKDKHRLNSFFNKLNIQKISTSNRNWKIYTGVDGLKMENVIDELNILLTDIEDKKRIFSHWETYPGSVGCYLSHIKLWQYILNSNSEYTLIMEDDSFFTPLGMINIELTLNSAKNMEWDILYIGHNILKGTKIHPLFTKPYIAKPGEKMLGYNSGLFGYIIRKSSINKLLNIVKTFETPFIDVHLRNKFGESKNDVLALFCVSNLIRHDHSGKSSRHGIDKINKTKLNLTMFNNV